MEGVGIYESAIVIKAFPLREFGGSVAETVWGCATRVRESEVSAAHGLQEGQKACCI